jgi:hypothetical protein
MSTLSRHARPFLAGPHSEDALLESERFVDVFNAENDVIHSEDVHPSTLGPGSGRFKPDMHLPLDCAGYRRTRYPDAPRRDLGTMQVKNILDRSSN